MMRLRSNNVTHRSSLSTLSNGRLLHDHRACLSRALHRYFKYNTQICVQAMFLIVTKNVYNI